MYSDKNQSSGGVCTGQEDGKEGLHENKETFRGDRPVHSLDYADGFTDHTYAKAY